MIHGNHGDVATRHDLAEVRHANGATGADHAAAVARSDYVVHVVVARSDEYHSAAKQNAFSVRDLHAMAKQNATDVHSLHVTEKQFAGFSHAKMNDHV